MKKLTTPKEVFEFIRDEPGFLEIHQFICIAIINMDDLTTDTIVKECEDLLIKNKPDNDSFTENKRWAGKDSWWDWRGAEEFSTLVLPEKRRFLTHLIEKL